MKKSVIVMMGSLIMATGFAADYGWDIKTLEKYYSESISVKNMEDIEWVSIWHESANKEDLPRVLMIGDSIMGQYRQQVTGKIKEALKSKK